VSQRVAILFKITVDVMDERSNDVKVLVDTVYSPV